MFLKKCFFASMLLAATLCSDEEIEINCAAVTCLSVDNSISIKFIDQETDDNLISNGVYSPSQITITDLQDTATNFKIQKDFEDEDVLVLDLENQSFGEIGYEVRITDGVVFNFTLNTSYGEGSECCGPYTNIDGVSVHNVVNEFSQYGTLPLRLTIFISD
nr:hypothetical protein [uncultured Allomuricauda sp.]